MQPAVRGKGLVGLVHHHQGAVGAGLRNQAAQHGRIPQVGGRVVGVSEIDDGRAVLRNSCGHGRLVQRKIALQGHADKAQSLQARRHGVHHKAGLGRQHGGAVVGTG